MKHLLDEVQYWERIVPSIENLTYGNVYWVIQDKEEPDDFWIMDDMDKKLMEEGDVLKESFTCCYSEHMLREYFTRIL